MRTNVHIRLRGICVALTAVSSAVADPPAGGPLPFIFDGSARLGAPLHFSLSRDVPTVDDAGLPVAPDQPRFAPPELLCGVPDIRTIPGTTGIGSIELLAGGVAADGVTPVWIVQNNNWGQVQILVGSDTSTPYVYDRSGNPDKGGAADFLRESIDNDPAEAWMPRAAVVCHGMAVALCSITSKGQTSGLYIANRVGIATCNLADLSGPKNLWWRRHAASDVLSNATSVLMSMGASWCMRNWYSTQRDGLPPTSAWVCATDYRVSPVKDGGTYFLFQITRSDAASSSWSAGPVVELPGRFTETNNTTHAHALGVAKSGVDGLIALGSRGDGLYHNVNYTWTIEQESNYAAGGTLAPGATNWLINPTAWTGPREVHGHVAPPTDNPAQRRIGNQWVSLAPGPTPGTFLTGPDEVNQGLWITSAIDANPAAVDFAPVYAPIATNWFLSAGVTHGKYLCFQLTTPSPNALGGPYVSQIGPSQFDADRSRTQRVLYSPNGVNWGQCWAHRENEQTAPIIIDNRVYVGSIGRSTLLGIRSIPIPATRLYRPLRVAHGGTNFLSPVVAVESIPSCAAVVPTSTPPSPPPCQGPIFRVTVAPTSAADADPFVGRFTLTPSIPTTGALCRLRYYIRPTPTAEGGVAGAYSVEVRLRSSDPADVSGTSKYSQYADAITIAGSGAWQPVVFTTRLSDWGTQIVPARLDLEFRTYGGQCLPSTFDVAFDSLTLGDPTPYSLGPGAAGANEVGTVSGLSLDSDFTVLAAGMVPMDSWDRLSATAADGDRPLLALVNAAGDRWVQVGADAPGGMLSVSFWDGTSYVDRGQLFDISYVPGSPLLLALTNDSAEHVVTLRASLGGTSIAAATMTDYDLAGPVTAIRFGDGAGSRVTPMDWFGGLAEARLWSNAEIEQALRSLSFLHEPPCQADFNADGFVTGDDFDAYVAVFELGDPPADFNGDGFVTGDDFDQFVAAFAVGC